MRDPAKVSVSLRKVFSFAKKQRLVIILVDDTAPTASDLLHSSLSGGVIVLTWCVCVSVHVCHFPDRTIRHKSTQFPAHEG